MSFTTDRSSEPHLVVQARFRGEVLDQHMLAPRSGRQRGARYRIGATARAGAPAPDRLGLAFLVLVEATSEGFRLRVTPGMSGTLTVAGRDLSLERWVEQHGPSFLLPPEARASLRCGDMEYRIDRAEPPPPVRAPLLRPRWAEQRYTVGTGAILLLVVALLSLLPPDARALSSQRFGRDVRFLPFRLVPLEERARPRPEAERSSGAPAPRAVVKLPRGSARPPARPDGDPPLRGRPGSARPQTALARADEIRSTGILGLLRPQGPTTLAWLFERGTALGHDEQALLAGLEGSHLGDASNVGGLSIRGTGAPRGHEGTIGAGRLETIGLGPAGRFDGPGGAATRLAARRTHTPEIVAERPTVRGALDKEIIRRVVRRHVNEIRYCYEQELPRAPALAGRLAVRFTIAPTGSVAAAVVDSGGLDNPRLQACTLQAVRRWTFPPPQGGGIVVATYPFTFVPAGQAP